MKNCEHMSFLAKVEVTRLTNGDNGPVTAFNSSVRVTCKDCGQKFRFVGLPMGYQTGGAAMSADGLEARLGLVIATEDNHPLPPAHPETVQ